MFICANMTNILMYFKTHAPQIFISCVVLIVRDNFFYTHTHKNTHAHAIVSSISKRNTKYLLKRYIEILTTRKNRKVLFVLCNYKPHHWLNLISHQLVYNLIVKAMFHQKLLRILTQLYLSMLLLD